MCTAATAAPFAARLKAQRRAEGLTQQQLADRSGVPVASVRNYEQGINEPAWDVFVRLARALGLSADALAGD